MTHRLEISAPNAEPWRLGVAPAPAQGCRDLKMLEIQVFRTDIYWDSDCDALSLTVLLDLFVGVKVVDPLQGVEV